MHRRKVAPIAAQASAFFLTAFVVFFLCVPLAGEREAKAMSLAPPGPSAALPAANALAPGKGEDSEDTPRARPALDPATSAHAGPAGASPPYEDVVYYHRPAAYWRMGESRGATIAADSSGNGVTATYRGVMLGEPGALYDDPDTAARFSASDGLDAGDRFDFASRAPFTLEVWASPRVVIDNGWRMLFHKELTDAWGRQGYTFWISRDPAQGRVVIASERFRNGAANSVSFSLPENEFRLRRWHHLAVSYDGSALTLYLNGRQVARNEQATLNLGDTSAPLVVGKASWAAAFPWSAPLSEAFPGKLDEAAVYTRALTAAEVRGHFAANPFYPAAIIDDAPAGFWRLGEREFASTARDASGNGLNGSYVRVTLDQPGAIMHEADSAVRFEDTASVELGDVLDFAGRAPFTLESWLYPTAVGNNQFHMVFQKDGVDSQGRQGYTLWLNRDPANATIVVGAERFRDGVRDVVQHAIPETRFRLKRWYHLAITYDGQALTLYLDGDRVAQVTSALSLRATSYGLRIGKTRGGGGFPGRLDEAAVFARALGAAEVRNHFAGNAPPSYRRTVEKDEPRGWWRLGDPVAGQDATLAYDASGNELDGVYGADVSRGAAGALRADDDTAARFLGADPGPGDEVLVGDSSLLDFGTWDFSVEAWLKMEPTSDRGEQVVVAKHNDDDGPDGPGWVLTVTDDPGYEGRVKAVLDHGVNSVTAYGPAVNVSDGDWHHVAFVVDRCNGEMACPDNGILLYVDRVGSITYAPPGSVSNDEPLTIGDADEYDPFDGTLDEVATYAYALSAGRVRAHYDAAVGLPAPYDAEVAIAEPNAAWRLGERPGTVQAVDETDGDMNGTYGEDVSPGVRGALMDDIDTAANFHGQEGDGRGDAVQVADHDYLDVGTDDFTVEAWVKTTRSEERAIVGKNPGTNGPNWHIVVDDNDQGYGGRARAKIALNNSTYLLAWGPPIRVNDGEWHHVAFVFARDQGVYAYVDGVEKFTPGVTRAWDISNNHNLEIGDTGNQLPFNGEIDDVALYHSIPTPGQLAAHYHAGSVSRVGAEYLSGDGIPTPAVVRTGGETYEWSLTNRHGGEPVHVVDWGNAGTPVAGDWDGDGIDALGTVDGKNWVLTDGYGGSPDYDFPFGNPGDVPVVGDWDGNGTDTPGVVRGNTWYLSNTFDGQIHYQCNFGLVGDKPVTGDWNGDLRDSIGVKRGSTWFLSNDNNGACAQHHQFLFGFPADEGVAGDWNGDGKDTPGLRRGGEWFLSDNLLGGSLYDYSFRYGVSSDRVVVGDWDPEPLDNWDGWEDPGAAEAEPQAFRLKTASAEASTLAAAPVDSGGAIVPATVKRYAPRVYIHSADANRPTRPLTVFIERSSLRFASNFQDEQVANRGDVRAKKLGLAGKPRRYHKETRNHSQWPDTVRFVATDCTRPYESPCSHRWGRSAELDRDAELWGEDGFFLDPQDSKSVWNGESDLRRVQTFYQYKPRRYVTYWLFFGYNDGAKGALGNHEGDWERVAVRLHYRTNTATEVAFYHHNCTPDFKEYPNEVELVPGTDHPVAFAAEGSHGTWPTPGPHDTCVPRVTDQTERSSAEHQWDTWTNIGAAWRQPWFGFGGAWGEIGKTFVSTGPLGPSLHKRWKPSWW